MWNTGVFETRLFSGLTLFILSGNKEKWEFPGVDRHFLGTAVLLDRFRWVDSQSPLSTSPLAAGRFLCCVLLDCHQMLVGEWKLCLSFPIHQFHLQSQGCKLVRKKKEEVFIPLNTLRLSFDVVNLDSVNLYSITFIAVCAGEPWRTFTTKSFIGVSSLTSAIVVTGTAAAEILLETK